MQGFNSPADGGPMAGCLAICPRTSLYERASQGLKGMAMKVVPVLREVVMFYGSSSKAEANAPACNQKR